MIKITIIIVCATPLQWCMALGEEFLCGTLRRGVCKMVNKILLLYRPRLFCCEDTNTDKQPVNKTIVGKLCSKLDLRLLEKFSVFLCTFGNVT